MLVLVLLCLGLLPCSLTTYRVLSLPEVCSPPQSKTTTRVNLEEGGAVVLSLGESVGRSHWRCDLELRAGPGFGLMVHVEEASLRPSLVRQDKCQDYIQLGRDDNTPFYTWDKTKQMCGDTALGATYDVPSGQLLVWVRLGGMAGLETTTLSLVVTAYLSEKDSELLTNYRACNEGGRFIRREFFCDGHVNCAADLQSSPADESLASCGPGQDDGSPSASPPLPGPPLNLLTITLVLVSATVLLIVLCVVVARLTHSGRRCCLSTPSPPELPDRAPSLGLLRAPAQARPHTTLLNTSTARAPQPEVRGTTPDSESEPPPAYRDLYPTGFAFDDEKIEPTVAASAGEEMEEVELERT
jgi:hypothetical protein